jgi:hypothetical protein
MHRLKTLGHGVHLRLSRLQASTRLQPANPEVVVPYERGRKPNSGHLQIMFFVSGQRQ